jgi:Bifunctional DNA primase/polymerase, N-terminal
MSSPLRDAAAVYHFELALSVILVSDKRPRVLWKNAPPWDDFEHLFDAPETTGVAVVLGKPSSDLVVRDFDNPQAFDRWEQEYPDLARVLPIARTGRDGGGYHVYGTMPGAPLVKLSDGELRGNGAIVVMPPSRHPTGSTYEWINPLNEIPRLVTMDELHATPNVGSVPSATRSLTEQTQAEPRQTEATLKQTQADPSIACVEQQLLIDRCIARNLPTSKGQRNQ